MSTCDRCFDGRHIRCMGRGDCTCNVCSKPRSTHDKKAQSRIRSKRKAPRTGARTIVHDTPPDWITVNEFEVTRGVLLNLRSLVDTRRCKMDLTVAQCAEEIGIPSSQLGRFLRDQLPQGFTAATLLRICDWGVKNY